MKYHEVFITDILNIAFETIYEHRRIKSCLLMWYIFEENKNTHKNGILVIRSHSINGRAE